jgi:hypothetical protein
MREESFSEHDCKRLLQSVAAYTAARAPVKRALRVATRA